MSDPILLFLTLDAAALFLLGAGAGAMPPAVSGFVTTLLCGLGALLCLPPLLSGIQATGLAIPVGPPGLSLNLALDSLSLFFLVVVFLAGTTVAALQATSVPLTRVASVRAVTFCMAGTVLSLLAADGVALAIGLSAAIAALRPNGPRMLVPVAALAAVCLLTPPGHAPSFEAIRAAPIDATQAILAAVLGIAAVAGLVWPHSDQHCWVRDGLMAGVLIPSASYLVLRLIADLSGAAGNAGWGLALLLAGGVTSVIQGWRSAAHPDIDGAVAALIRRQAGLALATIGLALVARAADLPAAATFAFDSACLTVIATGFAGTLTTLAAHAIGTSAGTYRLSRLGGLIHTMPATATALSAGLLALSALPPGLGFAALWLSLQAILAAPRTGGLASQLPLALAAAAIAMSAALATAASVRIAGIAILGRPRTPRGAGARESRSPVRSILALLAGASLLTGVLPGPVLWLLADPAIHILTGLPPARHGGPALLSIASAVPGYLALPVLALLTLAVMAAILPPRLSRKAARTAGPWLDGMQPPIGLPFGEPGAQSAGAGFLPVLPAMPHLRRRRLPAFPTLRPPSPTTGLWLLLAGFGGLLLVLAVTG